MTKELYRISEVGALIGFGRTKTYELINRGLIRTVHVDSSVRVSASAIRDFVTALESGVSVS